MLTDRGPVPLLAAHLLTVANFADPSHDLTCTDFAGYLLDVVIQN